MLSARGRANGCATAKGCSKQVVDLVSRIRCWEAVVELDLDEPHEERIEGAACGQELLGDVGERPADGDHARERAHLTTGALDVSDRRGPVRGAHAAHGDT